MANCLQALFRRPGARAASSRSATWSKLCLFSLQSMSEHVGGPCPSPSLFDLGALLCWCKRLAPLPFCLGRDEGKLRRRCLVGAPSLFNHCVCTRRFIALSLTEQGRPTTSNYWRAWSKKRWPCCSTTIGTLTYCLIDVDTSASVHVMPPPSIMCLSLSVQSDFYWQRSPLDAQSLEPPRGLELPLQIEWLPKSLGRREQRERAQLPSYASHINMFATRLVKIYYTWY